MSKGSDALMKRKESGLIGSAVIALIGLLLFSMSSPLYPTNPWGDTNCFATLGRGILAGRVPYRDLVEQKGAALYALYALAMAISPKGFFGVFLLEWLSGTLFLFISLQTLRLYRPVKAWLLLPIWLITLGSRFFVQGGSAEELCAPIFAFALYEGLRAEKSENLPASRILLQGFLAGFVFWVKYTLLGICFGWAAVMVLGSKSFRRAAKTAGLYLAGMAAGLFPWCFYLLANGALDDAFRVYLSNNLNGYTSDIGSVWGIVKNILKGVRKLIRDNPLPALMAASGTVSLLIRSSARRRVLLCAAFICGAAFIYFGGRRYDYYGYGLVCFVPLAAVPLSALADRLKNKLPRLYRPACGLALALSAALPLMTNGNVPHMFTPKQELPQTILAQRMLESDDPTLLNCGFLDHGFYLATGTLPSTKWFCTLNGFIPTCDREHAKLISGGEVEYVILKDMEMPPQYLPLYREVLTAESHYDPQHLGCVYRLYQRTDTY